MNHDLSMNCNLSCVRIQSCLESRQKQLFSLTIFCPILYENAYYIKVDGFMNYDFVEEGMFALSNLPLRSSRETTCFLFRILNLEYFQRV